MEAFPSEFGWYSYLTRILPGWPWLQPEDDRRIYAYGFSLLLVFLLAFVAEFFTKPPIVAAGRGRASVAAAQRGMAMFMFYMAIVVVVATDYFFFLSAVAGHLAGHFAAGILEYEAGAKDYYYMDHHYSY